MFEIRRLQRKESLAEMREVLTSKEGRGYRPRHLILVVKADRALVRNAMDMSGHSQIPWPSGVSDVSLPGIMHELCV